MTDAEWSGDLSAALLAGDAERARTLTERALHSGIPPEQLLDRALVPAIAEAGRRFEDQRFFLPELMLAARATKAALALVKPLLAERDVPPAGRVVIGTVAGDLHDIGKNIVGAMLEGGGFTVHDLGIDVAPAAFAAAVLEHDADIIGLSALLTTTMPGMRQVVEELHRAGVRERVKVLVGGAPLTAAYAAEIGADAYAATAAQAVSTAQRLLRGAGAVEPSDHDPSAMARPHPSMEPVRVVAAPAGPVPDRVASGTVTPRQLVKQALEFTSPSRLPRQMWLLPWASKRYPEDVTRLERDFPSDIVVVPIFCSEPVPGGGNAHTVGTFVDAWGCTFQNLQEGIIGQVKQPLVTDWSQADRIRFPRERLAVDRDRIAEFCRTTDRFVLAGTCPRPFERLQFLRGPENLYLDLNRPSKALRAFIERLHAYYVEELKIWAETEVDALTFMDDWGSQQGLLVAPDLWRQLFKPLYADYIAIAHAHGKHAFMHSDGHISEIISDLIEIGLDALNAQVFCMDIEDLGRRFAGKLTFWGELDRQQLLPRASTTQIAEAAARLRAAFHRDGGFIAQCEFGPGARPENVYAFFAACARG
jgi:uroporphyrinogen decarboxylase